MKRNYICITCILVAITVFSLLFYVSFAKEEQRTLEIPELKSPAISPIVKTEKSLRTNSETEYVLETLTVDASDITRKSKEIPAELVGKTNSELIQYVEEYTTNPSMKDSLDGLIQYEVISFSPSKIVLRKTYQNLKDTNEFFLKLQDKEVVVFYNDKKTVFQHTGILSENLTSHKKAELVIGFYVKSEKELYGILENLSS